MELAKALVTGGAGFIGSHLVEHLLAHGVNVTVLDDFSSGTIENLSQVTGNSSLEIVRGSVLDRAALVNALKGVDTVFHLAAIVSVARSLEDPLLVNRVNVEGTLTLLEESRKASVNRLIYASSCAVYGNAKKLPVNEEAPLDPMNPYAASKAAGEHYAMVYQRTYGMGVVFLRYTNVYGPRAAIWPHVGVMTKFAERLLSNQPPVVFGDGEQTRDFVYATDVAEATARAAKNSQAIGMVINVGSGIATTIKELAQIMADVSGRRHLEASRGERRRGEIRFSQADTNRAKKVLGFESKVSLREGIGNFLSWYVREESRLKGCSPLIGESMGPSRSLDKVNT